jgi:hypothetical protein
MKKVILLLVMFIGLSASAINVVFESEIIDENRFEKQVRKATAIAAKIRHANNLKHAPVLIYPSNKIPNAHASIFDKYINVYT